MLYDQRIPTKLKTKMYKTTIRPALTYRTKCWPIRKNHMQKMSATKMRLLKWMYGTTRKEEISAFE